MASRSISIGLSIFFGVSTFLYLNEFCLPLKQYFKDLSDVCLTDLSKPLDSRPSFFRFHIPGLDHFSCVITPFFKEAGQTPEGMLVMRELLGLYLAVLAMAAVESLRPTASGFVKRYPAVAGLSQAVGVSVAFPWCWLSSYWWANQHKQHPGLLPAAPRPSPPKLEPSPTKIAGITVACLGVLTPVFVAMSVPLGAPVTDDKWAEVLIAAFNPLAPLVCMVWALLPDTPGAAGQGHQRVKKLYYCIAGVAYAFHMWGVYTLLEPGFPLEKLQAIIAGATTDVAAAHFLVVDLAVLYVSVTWFVALEPLHGTIISFFVLSVLVGPGTALALFLVRREKVLGMAADTTKQD